MVGHVLPELLAREGEQHRLEGFLKELQAAQGAVSFEQVPGAPKFGFANPVHPRGKEAEHGDTHQVAVQ